MKIVLASSMLSILLFSFFSINAQKNMPQTSDSTQIYEKCFVFYPTGTEKPEKDWISAYTNQTTIFYKKQANEPIRIPVVVHVIHQDEAVGTGTNISYAQIQSQIAVLNQDFQRKNADTVRTPEQFKSVAGALSVEFVLADLDPDGQYLPEKGVNRVSLTSLGLANSTYGSNSVSNDIKPKTIWDTDKYLNIWVLDLTGTLLGFAVFPTAPFDDLPQSGNALTDGVVIDYQYFGLSGENAFPFELGRTATHEVGHWLGLYHLWGGCVFDDECEDTPQQGNSTSGCPFSKTACQPGQRAMFENYMDYSHDRCMNIFTQDQVARMQAVLQFAPRRKTVVANAATVLRTPDKLLGQVFVYPTPAEGSPVTVSIYNATKGKVQLQCYDAVGRMVNDITLTKTDEFMSYQLDFAEKPAGMYFLRISQDQETVVKKIQIVR